VDVELGDERQFAQQASRMAVHPVGYRQGLDEQGRPGRYIRRPGAEVGVRQHLQEGRRRSVWLPGDVRDRDRSIEDSVHTAEEVLRHHAELGRRTAGHLRRRRCRLAPAQSREDQHLQGQSLGALAHMTTQTDKATATSPEQQPKAPRRTLPEVPSWRRKLRPYLLSIPALVIVIGI